MRTIQRLSPLLWSATFIVGFGYCGWWLAALHAPWPLWLSSYCLLFYLITSGTGGVVPVSLWITGLILAAILTDSLPSFWSHKTEYRHWARVLLSLWGFCSLMIYLLGRQSEALHQTHDSLKIMQFWYLLITCLGLNLGKLAYQLGPLA